MRSVLSCRVLAAIAFFLSPIGDAAAQNVVANGDFAADLAGWTNTDVAKQWNAFDENDDPSSGSLSIRHLSAPGSTIYVEQCAPAAALTEYAFGFSHVTFAAATTGRADVRIIWFENATCVGSAAGVEVLQSEVEGSWTRVETLVTSPDAVQSVLVRVGARKDTGAAADEYRVYFDDIVLPEPGASAASLAAIAVLARRAARRTRAPADALGRRRARSMP